MQSISVSQRIRPTKVAFLVRSKQDKVIRLLVEYNSALWGGLFNPLIAIGPEYEKEALSLLDSTDPDWVVDFSELKLPSQLKDVIGQRIIERKELISERRGKTSYGGICDILPIIGHHVKTESKSFRPEEPTPASFPVWDKNTKIDLYCLFTFGRFPSNFNVDYRSILCRALRMDTLRIREDNVGSYDPWKLHTPLLYATELFIRYVHFERATIRYKEDHIIFVGDMSEMSDLVDFWNLRCMGVGVFFLPYDIYPYFTKSVTSFLKYGHYEIGESRVMHNTLIQKSRSIDNKTFERVCDWIKQQGDFELVLRERFPRWGKETECAKLVAKENEDVVMLVGDHLSRLRLAIPPFLEESNRWTLNECSYHIILQFRGYYGNDYCFRFPMDRNVEDMIRRRFLSSLLPGELRINREGICIRTRYLRKWQALYPIRTFDIFKQLFRTGGLTLVGYSEKGQYANRMIDLLGGIHECRILRKPTVRELLKKLQSGIENGDERRKEASVDKIEEILNSGKMDRGETPQTIIDVLDKQQVIRPGLRLKCRFCYKTGWYSIKEIGETFLCRYCGASQRVARIDKRPWLYRSHGLFHAQNIGYGSIPVILSLCFFHFHFWSDVKYLASIEIAFEKSSEPREVDFSLLLQRGSDAKHKLIIGEVTTHQRFKSRDFSLMEQVASRIPNVVIAFAMLKSELDPWEKSKINNLREKGYQILILTKRELESGDFPRAELPKGFNYFPNIEKMVTASNHLHLA